MTNTDDRRLYFSFWVPWEKANPGQRMCALELATEIIFSDQSAVTWVGAGWRQDYTRMKKFVPSTDADGFIDGQIAAILKAMTLWTAAKPAAS
jgi:hypothetical protein